MSVSRLTGCDLAYKLAQIKSVASTLSSSARGETKEGKKMSPKLKLKEKKEKRMRFLQAIALFFFFFEKQFFPYQQQQLYLLPSKAQVCSC